MQAGRYAFRARSRFVLGLLLVSAGSIGLHKALFSPASSVDWEDDPQLWLKAEQQLSVAPQQHVLQRVLMAQAPRAGAYCGALPTHYYHVLMDLVLPASELLVWADSCACAKIDVFVPPHCRTRTTAARRLLCELFPHISFRFVPRNDSTGLLEDAINRTSSNGGTKEVRWPQPDIRSRATSANAKRLRAHMLQAAAVSSTNYDLAVAAPEVVVVKRDSHGRRYMVNHDDVMAELHRAAAAGGWRAQSFRLERISILRQILLFSRATVVVAQHGAALANMLWMGSASAVIELGRRSCGTCASFAFEALAKHVGVLYVALDMVFMTITPASLSLPQSESGGNAEGVGSADGTYAVSAPTVQLARMVSELVGMELPKKAKELYEFCTSYQQYTSIVSHVQITQQQSPYLVCMLP